MQGLPFASLKLRAETERQNILKDFLLYPITYIRLVGLLCSIIVFGCVADQRTVSCFYNANNNCCNFAIAIGVLAFLLCLVFLMKDVLYNVLDFSDNITMKKLLLVIDIAVNGLWSFMWFVTFIYTADQWRKTSNIQGRLSVSNTNCANSGVAFSFFSILLWIAIVVVNAILLIRVIRSPGHPGKSGYSSFPEPPGTVSSPAQPVGSSDQPYSPPEY